MPTSIFPLMNNEISHLKRHINNEVQQLEAWDLRAKETSLRNSWHFYFTEEHSALLMNAYLLDNLTLKDTKINTVS